MAGMDDEQELTESPDLQQFLIVLFGSFFDVLNGG
jgi:hypothetical protein